MKLHKRLKLAIILLIAMLLRIWHTLMIVYG